MNLGIVIQARMGSTRLPNKALTLIEGKTCLGHIVTRCRAIPMPKKIIVATTKDSEDDPIEQFSKNEGVLCFRGDNKNVLKRFIDVGKEYSLDFLYRVTADCPLYDPDVAMQAYRLLEDSSHQLDYISNLTPRSFPRGLDVELVSLKALEKIASIDISQDDKEHVTLYLRNNLSDFKIASFSYDEDLSNMRWTLDTEKDLELIRRIYQGCQKSKPYFSFSKALAFYRANQDLHNLNRDEVQKIDAKSA